MSPSAALASSVFLFYAGLAIGLLVLAGALLAVLRFGLRKNVDSAWRSYRGWLLMAPLGIGAVFLGREVAILFFTGLAILGFREFARATSLADDRPMTRAVYLGIAAIGVVSLITDPYPPPRHGWYGMFMALPVHVVALILLVPIIRNQVEGQLRVLALAVVGFVYFGWMFGHLVFLCNAKEAYSYVLFLLFAVELNDIAAFTCGKLLGRHPLRSNISPKKTWEGSLGALAVSLALPWALWFTFPHLKPLELILAGLIVGIGGQLGDLAISVIKRDLGIKDMGTTIPGHGGILDRIDSLIYTAPLFFHLIHCFHEFY